MARLQHLSITVLVLVCFPQPTPAPVPRCSPFLFINKWAEFNSFWSDSNPYFPLPPCEYGGPLEALAQGDIKAVSVLASPLKIPRHNFYEFVWLLKTGLPRLARMITGQEKLITDPKILREGYRQAAPYVRTTQLGQNTRRRPEIIDNKSIYKSVVGGKIGELLTQGPDKHPKPYTPQGPLPGRRSTLRRTQRKPKFVEPKKFLSNRWKPLL